MLKYGVQTYGQTASDMRLIPLAREINDGMPVHMLNLIEQELEKQGMGLDEAKVAILGVSYLENADDTRNTPAAALASLLLAREAQVVAHDPHVRQLDWQRVLGDGHSVPLTTDLDQALKGADCAAIVCKHREYLKLTPQQVISLMRTPVVVDGRNATVPSDWSRKGIAVRLVGMG